MVPLFALLALAACNSEPTEEIRGDISQLVASPTQLFLEVGETKTVTVGAVDQQGNSLDFAYEVTAAGAGITVERDLSYLPIFVDDTTLEAPATGPQFQFVVEGTAYTTTSFTVSAGGQDIVIPVQVIPQAGLAATFDDDTVDLGQVVTVTAPAGVTFADTANLSLGTDSASLANPLTILTQDASTITFIPPPSMNSPVTINGVISASTPGLVYAPATQTPLVTPLIDTVDVTYSTTTPTLGQSVTLSVPEPLIKLAADSLIFPGQLPGREGDPQNVLVALDSSSLTFDAPPNINGAGTVVNFLFPGGYLRALPTLPPVIGENIGLTLPVTISNNTPAVSEVVTLTAPAGFTFDPATAITVGANAAVVTAVSGNTASFVPLPGSVGVPQIDGVVPTASPSNILTMAAEGDVTVPSEVPTLPGTGDPSTAPSLSTPDLGNRSALFDAPDFAANGFFGFYEFDVAQAGLYTITVDWNIGGDIDLFLCESPLAPDFSNCDFQAATGAHPEVGEYELDPGTYFVVLNDFGEDAVGTTVTIGIEHGAPTPGVASLRRSAPRDLAKLQRLLKK
jgi:hypothetical protein